MLVEIIARIRKIPCDVSTKQKDATILVELSTQGCYKEDAIIEFQLKNVRQEQTFQVLRDKENNVVLDMPRLNSKPRRADRKNEKVAIRKVSLGKVKHGYGGWKGKHPSIDLNNRKSEAKKIRIRLRQIGTWSQPDEEDMKPRDQCDQDGNPSYEIFDHIFPEKSVWMDEYEGNLQKKEDCPRNRRSS